MKKISAKVAAILSDYLVAFNVGTDSGVSEGDVVRIYRNTEVLDPESGEKLGEVRLSKLHLKINHVQAKLCVGIINEYQELHARQSTLLTPRRLKTVTQEPQDDDRSSVYVNIGEEAVIEASSLVDDPPF